MLEPGNSLNTSRFFSYLLLIGLVFFLLTGCEDEKAVQRSYPRINTLPVANITDEGATFSADLFFEGNETIVEYGFVWGIHEPRLGVNDKIVLDLPVKTGIYTAEIRSALIKDEDYYVKPYIKTIYHTVYGKTVKFISNGSLPPVITGFEPESAGWLDTLKISGRNFSWVASQNKVKLNAVECDVISCSDTSLYVKINSSVKTIENSISIELAGSLTTYIPGLFKLIPPSFTDFYPMQARWGDTIFIKGKYLRNVSLFSGDFIIAGTFPCTVLNPRTDTLIAILVPFDIKTLKNDLSIKINGFVLTGKQQLILTPPTDYKFTFSPSTATWGSSVVLSGKFHPVASRNTIFFNEFQATITSASSSSITVTVPVTLPIAKSNIIYKVSPFSIVTADTFRLSAPEVLSFSPVFGPTGNKVTISGKNFGVNRPVVKFGSVTVPSQNVTSYNSSTVSVLVPPLNNGAVKITVICNTIPAVSSTDFIVINPVITSVFPLSGTYNDVISIKGKDFFMNGSGSSVNVLFGNLYASVNSLSDTSILVKVPLNLDSIPVKIQVHSGGAIATSESSFILSPPQIQSIQPSQFTADEYITIKGSGFNPVYYYNSVFIDNYRVVTTSSTNTEIRAKVPFLPRGVKNLIVTTGKYKRSFPLDFDFKTQWVSIPLPSWFLWNDNNYKWENGIYFSNKELGFMMDYFYGKLTSFNPVNNEFIDLGVQQLFKGEEGLVTTGNQDTTYLIGGDLGLFRFDNTAKKWIWINNSPTNKRNGVAFYIRGKLYYGMPGDYFGTTQQFWVYNPKSNLWTVLKDVPEFTMFGYYGEVSFTINNKGYLLNQGKALLEYEPATDTWTNKNSFPGYVHGAVGFVVDNYGYVGLGRYDDRIWKYDHVNNTWATVSRIPGDMRYLSVCFVMNNKSYFGFGYNTSDMQLKEFLEFDATYPLF